MGYYINPLDTDKEAWLKKHGRSVRAPKWPGDGPDMLVCLVDGPFQSAWVCVAEGDIEVLRHIGVAAKLRFLVPKSALEGAR
jgi:hypothetical protein